MQLLRGDPDFLRTPLTIMATGLRHQPTAQSFIEKHGDCPWNLLPFGVFTFARNCLFYTAFVCMLATSHKKTNFMKILREIPLDKNVTITF